MIADPNLVNAIEGLTEQLSSVGLIMFLQLCIVVVVGLWFVIWTHQKSKE